ncbi:DnaA-like domain protein (plasmid) [Candidatus Megaera polyxenophila]|nr:DnaA-like domain protein [Candidatus Megaera polyxenophila]
MNSPFVTYGKVFKAGDVIIHTWYKQFCLEDGNPDLVAITILGDIVAWYRNGTNNYYGELTPKLHGHSLYLSYNYYEQKFGFREDRVRRALTRLYAQNILKRSFKNIYVKGRRVNKLVIDLDAGFFKSCFLDPKLDIKGVREEKKSYRLHGCYDQISTKTIFYKNRANVHAHESNFHKNSFAEEKPIQATAGLPVRGFSLASFYPLSQPEAAKLQALCGRGFSANAINEILLSMSKRLTDRYFKSKKAFMNYMAKALTYEKRDAVKISNETFRIRTNISADQIIKQKKEAFLSRIEESTDTSLAAQLNRKLASILAPDLAYDFLLAAKFPPHETSSTLKINLQKSIDLSEMQYRLILEQVQSVYGSSIRSLEFIVKLQGSPSTNTSNVIISDADNKKLLGVWGRIRASLIKTCGEAIDRNWFSKLTVNVDEEKGEIKLQAPTLFIRDWIQQNYQHLLEKFSNQENYRLIEVGV